MGHRFLASIMCVSLCSVGWALDLDSQQQFDIPAQKLSTALVEFSRQAKTPIVSSTPDVERFNSPGVAGRMSLKHALTILLQGTGLDIRTTDNGAIAVGNFGGKQLPESGAGAKTSGSSGASALPATAANSPGIERGGLGEIIVTAQKKSERLQDVPMSITALSSATLERSGAVTFADIGRQVPALNIVSAGPGQNQIIIRGVSSSGGGPTVGYYIDDTPMEDGGSPFDGNAMDPALLDLDRVEVLRGPQGTLYGAASMGGTVKFITKQPNLSESEGSVKTDLSGTEGGGLNYEASMLLNEPLVTDIAALRMMAFYRDADGFIDRYPIGSTDILAVGAGPVQKNVNTEKTYGARITLAVKAGDNFTITPYVWFQRTELGAPFTVDVPPGSLDNPIQTRDVDEPISDTLSLASVTVDGTIQGVHLTSSTAYRDRYFDDVEDDSKDSYYYFSPSPQTYVYPSPFYNRYGSHDFTEELRATYGKGKVQGLVGLFFAHNRDYSPYNWAVLPGYNAAFGTPFGGEPLYTGYESSDAIQRAAFGDVNVDLTQSLKATVGLRLFQITQTVATTTNGVFNGGLSSFTGGSKDSGTDPKFELSYQLTSDILTYASASKGFRQGGPVFGVPAVLCAADLKAIGLDAPPASFKSDSLWSYELGAKTEWLDRRLTVNAALYYINWNDLQQLIALPTCGVDFTGNFGSAKSKGGELEAQYEPVPDLQLGMGVAFNEAKLSASAPGAQGEAGDTLESAPRWMGSASAEYRKPIGAHITGFFRADLSSTTNQYNNFDKSSPYYNRPGYSLANARFGVEDRAWTGTFFIDNALNKHAETALPLAYGIDLPITRRLSFNQPRTVGIEFRVNW